MRLPLWAQAASPQSAAAGFTRVKKTPAQEAEKTDRDAASSPPGHRLGVDAGAGPASETVGPRGVWAHSWFRSRSLHLALRPHRPPRLSPSLYLFLAQMRIEHLLCAGPLHSPESTMGVASPLPAPCSADPPSPVLWSLVHVPGRRPASQTRGAWRQL